MKGFRDSSLRKFIDDFIKINYEAPLVKDVTSHTDKQILKAFCLDLLEDFQRELIYKNNEEYNFESNYEENVNINEEGELIDIL